MFKNQ
jgi:hypothetical protein